MLVLGRKPGEAVLLSNGVRVQVAKVTGNTVHIGKELKGGRTDGASRAHAEVG